MKSDRVVMKFILSKIKRLVVDSEGRFRYIENLDNVLYDVFGVKNFTKRLNQTYDDRDTISVMGTLGFGNLTKICNSSHNYEIFAELVAIDARKERLKRELRKADKKGKKKDKDLLKEYEYLSDIYKEATKVVRKRFGIKSAKKSYKKRYSSVSNLLDNRDYYDYDDEFSSVLYTSDIDLYSDYDEDDEDWDDDGLSELEEFRMRLEGKSRNRNKGRGRSERSSNSPRRIRRRIDEFDLDDEDDEDEWDDEEEEKEDTSDIDRKLDKLASSVSGIANSLQYMINTQQQPIIAEKLTPVVQPQYIASEALAPVHDFTNDMSPVIDKLVSVVSGLASQQRDTVSAMNQLVSTTDAMQRFLMDVFDEEADDDEDELPHEGLTREELIDTINKNPPATQTVPADTHKDIKDDSTERISQTELDN